jgi:hypothetical protein
MKSLDMDFSKIQEYNKSSVNLLADYFDINVSDDNRENKLQWFYNLSKLAQKNLGLAHCVLHNQTARGAIDITNNYTGSYSLYRPYATNVGTFSFLKTFTDTIKISGNRLTGKKYLASGLKNSDYFVFRVLDENKNKKWIFLDFTQISHTIESHYSGNIGMEIADPQDLIIDADIPSEWILDNHVSPDKLRFSLGFHNYGLITNYLSACKALFEIIKRAKMNNGNFGFELLKLENQIDLLDLSWEKNMLSIFEPMEGKEFWKARYTQYSFGKRTLIDCINLYLQITNSSSIQLDNKSQIFRDCLTFSSHVSSLCVNLENPERIETFQCT